PTSTAVASSTAPPRPPWRPSSSDAGRAPRGDSPAAAPLGADGAPLDGHWATAAAAGARPRGGHRAARAASLAARRVRAPGTLAPGLRALRGGRARDHGLDLGEGPRTGHLPRADRSPRRARLRGPGRASLDRAPPLLRA